MCERNLCQNMYFAKCVDDWLRRRRIKPRYRKQIEVALAMESIVYFALNVTFGNSRLRECMGINLIFERKWNSWSISFGTHYHFYYQNVKPVKVSPCAYENGELKVVQSSFSSTYIIITRKALE